MESLKKRNDKFSNHDDLLSHIEQLERKTSVIPSLEEKVHEMKHREKFFRRQSTLFPSASCIDLSKINEEKEKSSKLNMEVKRLMDELKKAKEENEIKEERYNRKLQQIMACFKKEMLEKDNTIRELNNIVVDLRGQIRVAIRVRDFDKDGSNFQITSQNEVKFQQNNQASLFTFENIFPPSTGQPEVFNEIRELILCALHGKNVSLIAYGPTSSGKTYTMRGEFGAENQGVIPRAICFMMEHSKQELASIGWKYNFEAAFIEVYNEEVFDLLDDKKKKLEIRITGSTTTVVGLEKIRIRNMDDVDKLLGLADSRRSVASTACNLHSSRSHAVFQIFIDGVNDSGETIKCCLNLVDLAGSERAKESGAQGKQFTELTNINKSLSTLKNCIRAQMNKMAHVPYRDSKLTCLLREVLGGGSSKTMFIAHVNPSDVSETKRTLEFTSDLRSTHIGKATVQTGQGAKV